MEELDLKELFEIFWNKKIQILLIIAIFICIGLAYSIAIVKPEYKTYTTLVLAKINETENVDTSITTTDITLNQKLVPTYSDLIKSKKVIRTVLKNLNIEADEEKLKNNITVEARKDTEIIEITVIGDKPDEIVKIANEIAVVFAEEVAEIYSISNVHVVDEAEIPEEPYNINYIKDIAIFAFIGIIVACVYVLIANMLDTTIKDVESIEKHIGAPVLVCIREYESPKKGGRK